MQENCFDQSRYFPAHILLPFLEWQILILIECLNEIGLFRV